MMYSRLMSGQSRRVSAANFNFYPEPSIHPDRVMTEHDFIYLLEGQWEVCQDGERYLMEPDDVLLLEAGRHHYGELPCLAGTRTMFLHVSAAPKDSLAVSGSLPIPTLTKACPLSVKIGFQQIIDEHYSKSPLREIRIAALIDLLLCDLAQTAEHAPEEWPVGAVRSILLKQPEVNYTAAELSAKLGLLERRLRYLFRHAAAPVSAGAQAGHGASAALYPARPHALRHCRNLRLQRRISPEPRLQAPLRAYAKGRQNPIITTQGDSRRFSAAGTALISCY